MHIEMILKNSLRNITASYGPLRAQLHALPAKRSGIGGRRRESLVFSTTNKLAAAVQQTAFGTGSVGRPVNRVSRLSCEYFSPCKYLNVMATATVIGRMSENVQRYVS